MNMVGVTEIPAVVTQCWLGDQSPQTANNAKNSYEAPLFIRGVVGDFTSYVSAYRHSHNYQSRNPLIAGTGSTTLASCVDGEKAMVPINGATRNGE
jgi:hypothetical protein